MENSQSVGGRPTTTTPRRDPISNRSYTFPHFMYAGNSDGSATCRVNYRECRMFAIRTTDKKFGVLSCVRSGNRRPTLDFVVLTCAIYPFGVVAM